MNVIGCEMSESTLATRRAAAAAAAATNHHIHYSNHILFDQQRADCSLIVGATPDFVRLYLQSSAISMDHSPAANSTLEELGSPALTPVFSTWVTVLIAALMMTMSLMTTVGNSLVIVSFFYDAKLRTVSNYYILNLAIADVLIGGFCIPLYMPYVLLGEWPFGRVMCKIFLVVDNIVCSASVLNIMLISSDRFLSVIHAINYRVSQTPQRAICKMTVVWVAAFLLYGPSTLFWEYFVGRTIVPENQCMAEFYTNFPYTFSVALVEFCTPLSSVTYINLRIYLNIKNRSRNINSKSHAALGNTPSNSTAMAVMKEKEARNLKRDKRAARALAIIVGAFSLSWAPYTVCNLVRALCSSCVPPEIFELTFWLLWANSTVNPFLYPYCHPQFRQVFETLICEKVCAPCLKEYLLRKRAERQISSGINNLQRNHRNHGGGTSVL